MSLERGKYSGKSAALLLSLIAEAVTSPARTPLEQCYFRPL